MDDDFEMAEMHWQKLGKAQGKICSCDKKEAEAQEVMTAAKALGESEEQPTPPKTPEAGLEIEKLRKELTEKLRKGLQRLQEDNQQLP